ncbi:MAG TPA: HipA family kinase [Candidatus Angelobacter sp.]|nr:HipA family kinase [Candidatus Angelobacter sp.]
MSNPLQAVEHVRRLRGGSQAQLMRASDDQYWVVKFQGGPQGTRILANEMFASRLGRWLNLPIPQTEAIEVSEELIERTPELHFDIGATRIKCMPGRHLASLYADQNGNMVFDYLPESLLSKVSNIGMFARSLVLDKWTCNSDSRQAVFTKKPRGRAYSATLIDQGYCFNAEEWDFPDCTLRGVYSRNAVYVRVTGWDSFEPALTRAEEADIVHLWRCAENIPPEWYKHDKPALEQLVETLYRRRGKLRTLITAFRDSPRIPFPNWTVREQVSVATDWYALAQSR